jgi:hypothetical protein
MILANDIQTCDEHHNLYANIGKQYLYLSVYYVKQMVLSV